MTSGSGAFPKESAFKQYEKEQKAHRERLGQIADEHSQDRLLMEKAASGRDPIRDPLVVSQSEIEEVYRRLNDLHEAAEGGNFKTAGVSATELADIRDLVYRNLP